jgi:tetratricopeptide (TPR) repeat protein
LVVSSNGDCRCGVISRFEKGLPTHLAGTIGVRALKLPTVEAPVQIRLVGKDGKPHPRAASVSIVGGDANYAIAPSAGDGFTYQNGTFRSARALANVACLSVSLSPTWTERFPVPVYGEGPITLTFEFDEKKAKLAELEKACWALRGRVAEAHNAAATLYTALIALVKAGKNREALARVKAGVAVARGTEKSLAADLESLRKRPGADAGYAASQLKDCETQIHSFHDVIGQLNANTAKLEEAAKLDPVRLEKEFRANDLKELIQRQISIGEVPEALDIFDELIKLTNDENQKVAKEKLLKEWTAKTDAHRIAREVILKTWPDAQSLEEFQAAVKKLASAIRECMKQNDKLGLRKLMNTFNPAYAKLDGLSQGLDANIKADEERIKAIQKVSEDSHDIEEQVRDWLKQNVK